MANHDVWSTSAEVDFIHSLATTGTPRERLVKVANYLNAIPKRERWDNLDKKVIARAAEKELMGLRGLCNG